MSDRAKEMFPDACPLCGSPAYIGAIEIECSSSSCHHGSEEASRKYFEAAHDDYLEERESYPDVDEDADTEPRVDPLEILNKLTGKLSFLLMPFGTVQSHRAAYEDRVEFMFHNKHMDMFACYSVDAELLWHPQSESWYDSLVAGVARDLLLRFLQERQKQAVAVNMDDVILDGKVDPVALGLRGYCEGMDSEFYQLPEGAARAFCIGDYFLACSGQYRVTSIDRANDILGVYRAS